MRIVRASLFAVAALAATSLTACKGGEADKPADSKPKVKWPAKPTDGSNVAVVFKSMTGEGDRLSGKFDVFNFSEDENISEMRMTLEYKDKDGKVIKTFPHTQIKAFYNKEVAEMEAGFFVPKETVSMSAKVHYVKFNTKEWGSKSGSSASIKVAPTSAVTSAAIKVAPASAAPASAAPASAK